MRNINDIGTEITNALFNAVNNIISFLPNIVAALIIYLIGLFVASLLRTGVTRAMDAMRVNTWLEKAGISQEPTRAIWTKIFGQLVFWTVMVLFLVPAVEALGVPQITRVMNDLLLYLPNVFAAVVIGFIGMILANFLYEIITNAAQGFGERAAGIMANIARYSIIIFTAFIVLNELGVAENLIQILFTGVVATMAIGFGLAIGLGGQEGIRRLIDTGMQSKVFQNKIKPPHQK